MLLALPLRSAHHRVQLVQLASIPQDLVVHALLVQLESSQPRLAHHRAQTVLLALHHRPAQHPQHHVQPVWPASIPQQVVNALLVQLESLELVEAPPLHAQAMFHVRLVHMPLQAPNRTLSLMKLFAPSALLENMAQQLGLPLAIVPAMFHVLVESTPYLVQFQICGQMPLFVQTAQQVLLPYLAQQLALYASQVNGQLQVQQPVQIVLLVALALALQISAQEHAQLAIIQKAASVNARYVQQERLELVKVPPLLARALSHVPLASTRCLEQHPIL